MFAFHVIFLSVGCKLKEGLKSYLVPKPVRYLGNAKEQATFGAPARSNHMSLPETP